MTTGRSNPSTHSNLLGSRNDVISLASYLVEVLGVPVENIVALTTPVLAPDDLEEHPSLVGMVRGCASEEEVKRRLARLLDASKGGTALLTFSGHGAALSDGEPVLCLGDAERDDDRGFKRGVIRLRTIRDEVRNAGAKKRLIALFDCCHVASPSTARAKPQVTSPAARRKIQVTSLAHVTEGDVTKQKDAFRVSHRVFLAARPGKEAYQVLLGRVWHGALTFALVTAADRWLGGNGMSHGSYKGVLQRAKSTLEALEVPQKIKLRVPGRRWVEIRNSPFMGTKTKVDTVPKPDAQKFGQQLNPDFRYQIKLDDGQVLADIVATKDVSVRLNDHDSPTRTECWFVNPGLLAGLDQVQSLRISATTPLDPPITTDPSCKKSFYSQELAQWSRGLAPRGRGKTFIFSGRAAVPEGATAYLVITLSETGDLAGVQWGVTVYPGDQGFNPGSEAGTLYTASALPADMNFWTASSL
ncbi:MAG: caspase family protein [Minicystis sp.]